MATPYHRNSVRPFVSAVVPAYNEAARIGAVLQTLINTPVIDEIIVVDDASTDGTKEIVRRYSVRCLRLARNGGKARAMAAGVRRARGDIIFFADADVRGLTPAIVKEIIAPVADGEVEMFIATRNRKVYFLSFLLIRYAIRPIPETATPAVIGSNSGAAQLPYPGGESVQSQ